MQTIVNETWRVAKKNHKCDLCGEFIKVGDRYHDSFIAEGDMAWHFKSHDKCNFVFGEIYDYFDPDDGMSQDDFIEACSEICNAFICPDCDKHKHDECDSYGCLDPVYDFLQKYELYCAGRDQLTRIWKVRERKTQHG